MSAYKKFICFMCCEMQGVHWCDKRRSISEYKPLFPAIDFSLASTFALLTWEIFGLTLAFWYDLPAATYLEFFY